MILHSVELSLFRTIFSLYLYLSPNLCFCLWLFMSVCISLSLSLSLFFYLSPSLLLSICLPYTWALLQTRLTLAGEVGGGVEEYTIYIPHYICIFTLSFSLSISFSLPPDLSPTYLSTAADTPPSRRRSGRDRRSYFWNRSWSRSRSSWAGSGHIRVAGPAGRSSEFLVIRRLHELSSMLIW